MMRRILVPLILACSFWVLPLDVLAAATDGGAQQQAERRIPVRVVRATRRDIEIWERSVGQLEPKVAPLIAAEVAGRLTSVRVDVGARIHKGEVLATIDPGDYELAERLARADIRRLAALIRGQRLKVRRLQALVRKRSANQSALDDAEARLDALQAEHLAAQVRLQQAQRNLARTRITSPIDGRVDATQVSMGDYVKPGTPLMRIGNLHWLKARLPYPETLLPRLHAGLPVRLTSPSAPGIRVTGRVSHVRPSITFGSRAVQVIVNVENPGPWQPGASVTGEVRVALHKGAVVVPEASVVRRPAGTVLYLIEGGHAHQRRVRTGVTRDGQVEIRSGLAAGETVAVDGAGFLTDGAAVEVRP